MVRIDACDDLRSIATPSFEAALQPVPPGVSTTFGPSAPFGSAEFARRDAAEITAATLVEPPGPISGWRAHGSLWEGQRLALRVPKDWNGRLVVAGCPGQRTEFACDRLFGDPLLSRGYAYVSGNKGNGDGVAVLEKDVRLNVDGAALPRFPLRDGRGVSFWQHAPGRRMERWVDEMSGMASLARDVLADLHRRDVEVTYAIGLSNGGYQVRRAIEESSQFDGALTWNAVLWSLPANPLQSLIEAIAAMETGAPQRLLEIGFPPDVASASGNATLYAKNLMTYWYVTAWLHATMLDPVTSTTYGDVGDPAPAESWCARISQWNRWSDPEIERRIAAFANTGAIRCKLVDVASEYDHLIPPKIHFDPYARLVEAAGAARRYRGVLVRDAQHVDSWSPDPEYPAMKPGQPSVLAAWDELVRWVEGAGVTSP